MLGTGSSHASPLYADPLSLLRAGRFEEIRNLFRSKPPEDISQRYALARANEEKSDPSSAAANHRVMEQYLSVIGIRCEVRSEAQMIDCMSGGGAENRSDIYSRLSINRIDSIAESMGWKGARLRILELASLANDDVLSRGFYAKRIALLLDFNRRDDAKSLALKQDHLRSSLVSMRRAASFQKNGNIDAALNHYLIAASQSGTEWLMSAVHANLKKQYPELFTAETATQQIHRKFVFFSELLSDAHFATLRKRLNDRDILSSTGPETVLYDGLFFIRSGRSDLLPGLAESNYTYLSLNPGILYRWQRALFKSKDYKTINKLFSSFDHVKKRDSSVWRMKIETLDATGENEKLFDELVEYLAINHSDQRVADRLIEFLIGTGNGNRKWAPADYWRRAREKLPFQTGNGRFTYWLHRYYKETGNSFAARDTALRFYEMAPGSYYAHAFWDGKSSRDFAAEWTYVHDRPSYLRWIAEHGGNLKAIQFLAGQNITPYRDPLSIRLAADLENMRINIPTEIMELYRMGEYSLAEEFYADRFEGRLSMIQNLMQKFYIGKTTGNLFISVYYLRRLLREMNIPEDPFSLPPAILRELYPRPYLPLVQKYSARYGIDANMIYGLMRQESMFRELAVSRTGAKGLMQIMPSTGRWLANMMKLNRPNLHDPEISIQMGTKFFSDLLKHHDNDFRWASIAYNGGPGNLRKWKRNHYENDFNLFLEKLPSEESRNYCRVTYQNFSHYRTTYILYPQ
jgi:hypothetical protein